jgi:hypothetical protein
MAAAVGIGVIASARTRLFIGYLWRGGYTFGDWGFGARLVCRATVENAGAGASDDFIGGFAIGGNRWVAAQRIGGGAV